MNRMKTLKCLKMLAASSLCLAGAAFADPAQGDAGGDKFGRINNDAVRTVETMNQLSPEQVAALGKKDGVSNTRMRGSIKASGFSAARKTEKRNSASPAEIAERAAAKKARGLHGSVKGGKFSPPGQIKRVHMDADDLDVKGASLRDEVPTDFVKTKETP